MAEDFSETIGVEVGIERVDLEWFTTISLEGVYIEDLEGDTLLYAGALKGNISRIDPWDKKLHFSKVALKRPHVELKRYASSPELNHNFLLEHFSSEDTTGRTWDLKTERVEVQGGSFSFRDHHKERGNLGVFTPHDLSLEGIRTEIGGIGIEKDSVSADIKMLAFKEERSGFTLDSLVSHASYSKSGIRLKELLLKTPGSDLRGDLNFLYQDPQAMSEWIERVEMDLDLELSKFDSRDIGTFVPALQGIDRSIEIGGRVRGKVSDLRSKALTLALTPQTYFKGRVELNGLPNIKGTFISVDAKKLSARKKDLERIPLPPFKDDRTLSLPPQLKRLGDITFTGRFTGFINDFVANGSLNTEKGGLRADVSFSRDTASGRFQYDGSAVAKGFDVGSYYRIPGMGEVEATMELKGSGFGVERVNTQLDGTIHRFEYLDYNYRNVNVEGELHNKHFIGRTEAKDPNFDFSFNGSVDFRDEIPEYGFTMHIDKAKPGVLNWMDRDSSVSFSTRLEFDGKGADLQELKGKLGAYGTIYQEKGLRYEIGDVELIAEKEEGVRDIRLISRPLSASLEGDFVLSELPHHFSEQVRKVLPALFAEGTNEEASSKQNFEFNFRLMEHQKLSSIFFPKWRVGANSVVNGSFNSEKDRFELEAFLPYLEHADQRAEGITFSSFRRDDVLEMDLLLDTLKPRDSLYFEHLHLLGKALDNTLQLQTKWKDGEPRTRGSMESVLTFKDRNRYNFEILSSDFLIKDKDWEFKPNGRIEVAEESIRFKQLAFGDSARSVDIEGTISKNPNEELSVRFEDFKLGILDPFLPEKLAPKGIINGQAVASGLLGEPFFSSDLTISDAGIAQHQLGDLQLSSNWKNDNKILSIKGTLKNNGTKKLDINGKYAPDEEEELDVQLETEKLGLEPLNGLIEGGISDIHGTISGPLSLGGSLSKPILTGSIQAESIQLTVSELNVTYGFDQAPITFYEDMIGFDYIPIHYQHPKTGEQVKKRGHATGTLIHDHFKRWNFNIFLEMDRLLAMNLDKGMNDSYYGTAYGSGDMEISGDPEILRITVNAKTEKGTDLKLPLGGSQDVQMEEFVSFVDQDAEDKKKEQRKKDLENVDMDFNLNLTPAAKVSIIFDEKIGDVMKGRGEGNIEMNVNTKGKFKMRGKYEVHQGDYLFTMQNFINKRFSVQKGGTIEWFGDPYKASLNLDAIYELRTSIYPLMQGIEGDEAYKRRVPVKLIMHLSRDLMNPEVAFDIQFPSLEQDLKMRAMSRIESMNKQAFSLLVMKRFASEQRRGGASAGDKVGQSTKGTSSELLSNQLSNWLSSISEEFDLGVNYRPGDEVTDEELAVALSTQLFDERVSFSGNFGVSSASEYSQQQGRSQNNLVGDFTIQYDITEDGKFQLKVFNESNQDRISRIQGADYTQGVGLYYQEEFDSASELLHGLREFFSKKDEEGKGKDPEGDKKDDAEEEGKDEEKDERE